MATKEEKQQLIDTLRFTPRTYRISMWGYGGERVMGRVDPKAWDYCLKNRVDLVDLAWGYEYSEENGLDDEQLPFTPGSWYECDSMGHSYGVSRDIGTLQIEDENGTVVYEHAVQDLCGQDGEPGWACNDEVWIGMAKKGEVVFIGSSNEKGTFFEGEFELRAPFDIEKLELHYDEIDGEEIITGAYYDGEEIENNGGSTDGKSSDMNMVRIIDDEGNWERYELPEEENLDIDLNQGLPHETGTENPVDFPETWDPVAELDKVLDEFREEFGEAKVEWADEQKTEWFPIKIKPVHQGVYECQFKKAPAWPWPPTADLTWTGKTWVNDDGDKVTGVKEWRGLREPA